MKAIDYVNKYGEDLVSPDEEKRNKAVNNLLIEMLKEQEEVMKTRSISRDGAAISVIKEFNQKWNAINRKLKIPVLNEDGYKKVWIHKLPELADVL